MAEDEKLAKSGGRNLRTALAGDDPLGLGVREYQRPIDRADLRREFNELYADPKTSPTVEDRIKILEGFGLEIIKGDEASYVKIGKDEIDVRYINVLHHSEQREENGKKIDTEILMIRQGGSGSPSPYFAKQIDFIGGKTNQDGITIGKDGIRMAEELPTLGQGTYTFIDNKGNFATAQFKYKAAPDSIRDSVRHEEMDISAKGAAIIRSGPKNGAKEEYKGTHETQISREDLIKAGLDESKKQARADHINDGNSGQLTPTAIRVATENVRSSAQEV